MQILIRSNGITEMKQDWVLGLTLPLIWEELLLLANYIIKMLTVSTIIIKSLFQIWLKHFINETV